MYVVSNLLLAFCALGPTGFLARTLGVVKPSRASESYSSFRRKNTVNCEVFFRVTLANPLRRFSHVEGKIWTMALVDARPLSRLGPAS